MPADLSNILLLTFIIVLCFPSRFLPCDGAAPRRSFPTWTCSQLRLLLAAGYILGAIFMFIVSVSSLSHCITSSIVPSGCRRVTCRREDHGSMADTNSSRKGLVFALLHFKVIPFTLCRPRGQTRSLTQRALFVGCPRAIGA